MRLSIEQLMPLRQGLAELDGYDRAVKDGERERVVKEYYKFSGPFRLLVARNQNRIDARLADYTKAQEALLRQHANGGTELSAKDNPDGFAAYMEQIREVMSAEEEIDLPSIEEHELKLADNPIPASTLAKLMPIIKAS